jgi:hypothetical protein
MSINNKLNLVYDNWDDTINLPYQPNSMKLYPNSYHMPFDAVVNGLNMKNDLIDMIEKLQNNFMNCWLSLNISQKENIIKYSYLKYKK